MFNSKEIKVLEKWVSDIEMQVITLKSRVRELEDDTSVRPRAEEVVVKFVVKNGDTHELSVLDVLDLLLSHMGVEIENVPMPKHKPFALKPVAQEKTNDH